MAGVTLCRNCGETIQRRRVSGTSKRGWRATTAKDPWSCYVAAPLALTGASLRVRTRAGHLPQDEPLDLADRRAVERWLRT